MSGGHWRAFNQVNRLQVTRPGEQSRDITVRSETFLFNGELSFVMAAVMVWQICKQKVAETSKEDFLGKFCNK